jgi:hypothetical protein
VGEGGEVSDRRLEGPAIAEVVGAVGAADERVLADRMLARRVNP